MALYEQYLEEKATLEAYGHTSVVTYEEWLEIKGFKKVEMKVLTLSLKRKWYDMIASGEKTEEYREIKPYWIKRMYLCNYDAVTFTLGYPKADDKSRRMTFRVKDIHVSYGREEWGAEKGVEYFVISLGERIKEEQP